MATLFGQVWEKFGYFLFYNLVTLVGSQEASVVLFEITNEPTTALNLHGKAMSSIFFLSFAPHFSTRKSLFNPEEENGKPVLRLFRCRALNSKYLEEQLLLYGHQCKHYLSISLYFLGEQWLRQSSRFWQQRTRVWIQPSSIFINRTFVCCSLLKKRKKKKEAPLKSVLLW